MKVGDYVRTKYGIIARITDIIEDLSIDCDKDVYYEANLKDNMPMMEIPYKLKDEYIIKSSPNIIDLIEVGDIITFKDDEDVYKVIGRPDKECALEVFYLAKKYDGNTEDIMVYPDEMKKYIKSIVTKEQFESKEYKVGEDK